MRVDGKVTRAFSTFTPVALAVIGGLPLALSHRSVTIDMVRAPAGTELTRFDELNVDQNADFRTVYRAIFHWARQCELKPQIRRCLRVAQSGGRQLALLAEHSGCVRTGVGQEESGSGDRDQQIGFRGYGRNAASRYPRCFRSTTDGRSRHQRGDRRRSQGTAGRDVGRAVKTGKLARLLKPFGIRPGTIWRPVRETNDKSAKGYRGSQFEASWQAYCDSAPSQRGNVRYLRGG